MFVITTCTCMHNDILCMSVYLEKPMHVSLQHNVRAIRSRSRSRSRTVYFSNISRRKMNTHIYTQLRVHTQAFAYTYTHAHTRAQAHACTYLHTTLTHSLIHAENTTTYRGDQRKGKHSYLFTLMGGTSTTILVKSFTRLS